MVNPPPLFVDPHRTPELWQSLVQIFAEDVFVELVVSGLDHTMAILEANAIVKNYVQYRTGQSRLTDWIHQENNRKRKCDVPR